MKKKVYLILLAILVIVAAYFYFSNNESTLREEHSNFAITDTASIDKIFIADQNGNNALLERMSDNSWEINGKYTARMDAIDILLETFQGIAVKEPIAKAALQNVIKSLAVNSTKVEIYTGGKSPEKVYYVGHATKSHEGTNMLLEINGKKSSLPYVTHVPGFYGYLSTRFFTEEYLWKDRAVFELMPEEIQSIELTYLEKPLKSFHIAVTENGYEISDISKEGKLESVYKDAVKGYFENFESIHYEYVDMNLDSLYIDSVIKTAPLHHIVVQTKNGENIDLKTYYKPVNPGSINESTGEEYEHNVDRLYGWVNENEFVVMQWPTIDKTLAYLEDFKAPIMLKINDN